MLIRLDNETLVFTQSTTHAFLVLLLQQETKKQGTKKRALLLLNTDNDVN